MSGAAWATLIIAFSVAIMSPGPDVFLLLRLGVRDRRAAVLAALGIMIGNTIWTIASVAGLAAFMCALPGLLPALQVLGSAVLVWIGVQSIRAGVRAFKDRGRADPDITLGVTPHPVRLGFITNLSNPKALLFFTALFSQILPLEAPFIDRVLIVVVITLVGLAWFVAFALLTSSRVFQRWFGRVLPYIDILAGAVFILVAAVILVELALTSLR